MGGRRLQVMPVRAVKACWCLQEPSWASCILLPHGGPGLEGNGPEVTYSRGISVGCYKDKDKWHVDMEHPGKGWDREGVAV